LGVEDWEFEVGGWELRVEGSVLGFGVGVWCLRVKVLGFTV